MTALLIVLTLLSLLAAALLLLGLCRAASGDGHVLPVDVPDSDGETM
jgi:hypothetical protein